MRTLIGFTFIAALTCGAVGAAPLEDGAQYTKGWSPSYAQKLADEASALVRSWGYTCDSVTILQRWTYSSGFRLVCNDYLYSYELENKGGRMLVRVK